MSQGLFFFFKDADEMIYVCESHRLSSLWELYAVFPALEVNRAGNWTPLLPALVHRILRSWHL